MQGVGVHRGPPGALVVIGRGERLTDPRLSYSPRAALSRWTGSNCEMVSL